VVGTAGAECRQSDASQLTGAYVTLGSLMCHMQHSCQLLYACGQQISGQVASITSVERHAHLYVCHLQRWKLWPAFAEGWYGLLNVALSHTCTEMNIPGLRVKNALATAVQHEVSLYQEPADGSRSKQSAVQAMQGMILPNEESSDGMAQLQCSQQ
jgi:hypothetical protein